jgi:hypothetical protein
MVQRFEFPLVEHLLRSPRRHTYRSIRFRWTHCEKPRFGVGRPSPVWSVARVQPQMLFSSCFSTHIYFRLSHVHLEQISDSYLLRSNVGAIGSVCRCLNLSTSTGGTRSKVEGGDRHDLEPEGMCEDTRHKIYTGSGSQSSYPTSYLE